MDRRQQIRMEIAKLRDELHDLEFAEMDPLARAMVGKCYRLRNSYSLPKGDSDYWPLFSRVTGVNDGRVVVMQFEIDKDGKCELHTAGICHPSTNLGEEISHDEWRAAFIAFMGQIESEAASELVS